MKTMMMKPRLMACMMLMLIGVQDMLLIQKNINML